MNFTEINLDFAAKSNKLGQRYPALQSTDYQPRSLSEQPGFCLSSDSADLLAPDANTQVLNGEVTECRYGRDSVLMYQVKDLRWIFLNIPQVFLLDKKSKQISYPERGIKLAGTGKVTIAKCFLACLSGDNLVLDADGLPQIFTLKLTSSKTQLIGYQDNPSETSTINSINTSLQKHFKSKENFIHLVSVKLAIKPKEFVSTLSGESSLGIMFEIDGEAQPLSSSQQQQIFDFINLEDTQALFDDPFGLKRSQAFLPQPQVNHELTSSYDEIAF